MYALDIEQNKTTASTVTSKQAKALLSDPLNTFSYAYEAEAGAGSRSLVRAAYHAKDLGASTEDIQTLIRDINNYWYSPLEHSRLDNILKQVERL
jgi:hypothetical protein